MNRATSRTCFITWLCLGELVACAGAADDGARVGQRLERRGDEIVVCGQLYHTTAPVVLWMDPGGYDAYRLERRFVPLDQAATPPREKAGRAAWPTASACVARGSPTWKSSEFVAVAGTFPCFKRWSTSSSFITMRGGPASAASRCFMISAG